MPTNTCDPVVTHSSYQAAEAPILTKTECGCSENDQYIPYEDTFKKKHVCKTCRGVICADCNYFHKENCPKCDEKKIELEEKRK